MAKGIPVVISDNGYGIPVTVVEKLGVYATIATNGLGIPVTIVPSGGTPMIIDGAEEWTPADLFKDGEQGGWYDPSDLSTMFQNIAGTIPALQGDPVGLVLDKSGNIINLSQTTAAARPTLLDVSGNLGLRFDLADDALTTTLPQAINGDLLIAGTNGTIIEPFSGDTLTIGPTSYTGGTPGILAAIGGIVGVLVIDRSLTQVEKDQLIAYYKNKGAKGLLVPDGPEIANDLFSLVPSANKTRCTLEVAGDNIVLTATETGVCFADIVIPNPGNIPLILQAEISSPSGRPAAMAGSNGTAYTLFVSTEQYQYRSTVGQRNAPWTIRFRLDASIVGQQAFFRNVSLKELRAQEDWT